MRSIIIRFNKRRAIVTLPKEAYDKRMNGLIQFLASFCENVTYEVLNNEIEESEK